jgi:type II secretory pathway pseudopilin PulG
MNIDIFTKKKGFTLLEVLLYVAILSTILVTITSFLFAMLQFNVRGNVTTEVEQQGVQVMQLITQSVRSSEGINSPLLGTTSNTLSLVTDDTGLNPTIYELNNTSLQLTEGINLSEILTNDKVEVTDLTFRNIGRPDTDGIVRVEFTLTHVNPENRNEYNYSKTFYGSAAIRP